MRRSKHGIYRVPEITIREPFKVFSHPEGYTIQCGETVVVKFKSEEEANLLAKNLNKTFATHFEEF